MGEGVTSVSLNCKELASVPSVYHALGHRWGDTSGHTLTLSPGASGADEELPLLRVGRAVRGTGTVLQGTQAGTSNAAVVRATDISPRVDVPVGHQGCKDDRPLVTCGGGGGSRVAEGHFCCFGER